MRSTRQESCFWYASAAARLTVAGRLEPTVEAALGRLTPASPRHLALVEATRIAYQRSAATVEHQLLRRTVACLCRLFEQLQHVLGAEQRSGFVGLERAACGCGYGKCRGAHVVRQLGDERHIVFAKTEPAPNDF